MNAYKNELITPVKWYKRIFNVDRLVLYAGATNNYGQNWLKPIGIAIFLHFVFHFLIIVGVSDKLSYCPNFDYDSFLITWDEYKLHFDAFPQLLNPTHVLSRVFPEVQHISSTVYFLAYLLKIILAFFIFQIISAFRKNMK